MRLRFVLLSIALLRDNNGGLGVDAFVNPQPSITTRHPVVVQNSIDPDSSLDEELQYLMQQRDQIEQRFASNDELSQLLLQRGQLEQRLKSNFQESAPTTTVANLADSELAREKLKREVEDAEKRRKALEAQLDLSKKKQEMGKAELRKAVQERDVTRSAVREITGGTTGLFPVATLSLGALAAGRSALEQRRKKLEGTNIFLNASNAVPCLLHSSNCDGFILLRS